MVYYQCFQRGNSRGRKRKTEKSKKVEKRLDLIRNKWYIISAFKGKGEREIKK